MPLDQQTIGPAKELTPEEKKKRQKIALELYKKETDPNRDKLFIDENELKSDPDFKKQFESAQKEKYNINPEYGKFEKNDGKWSVEPQSNAFDQFAGGYLRPFEKLSKGDKAPSTLNAYRVPDEGLTTGQKVARGAGELAGYATEYAPVMKGFGMLTKGAAVAPVVADMITGGLAGATISGVESRGDPIKTGAGFGMGLIAPPAIQYVGKPAAKAIFNTGKKILNPLIKKFSGNVAKNMAENLDGLAEPQIKQAISQPENVVATITKSVDDTIDDVAPQINTQNLVTEKNGYKMPAGLKENKFTTTIKESPKTDPVVVANVKSKYTPITNNETLETAKKAIFDDEGGALSLVLSDSPNDPHQTAVAQLLIDKLSKEGKHEQAVELVQKISQKLTAQGQSIQAASMWNRLTPAGVLKTAERAFKTANEENPKLGLKLTNELAEELAKTAENIQAMPDGEGKYRATLMMLKKISDKIPVGWQKKVSTAQTIAQLLNPKTAARNVLGNTMFQGAENVSQTNSAILDKMISMATGKRTTLMPSVKNQAKGFAYGANQGFKDVMQGVDTSGGMSTQFNLTTGQLNKYGLPQASPFTSKAGKGIEKTLGMTLKVPDRAFSEAAYADSIEMAKKLATINKVPFNEKEAIDAAKYLAEYRTFQDPSAWANAFQKIKQGLNAGQDFGLGDMVLKYPKTPANILARGIDYSPVGFVRSLAPAYKLLKTGDIKNQKELVDYLGRSITGTGAITTGYYLAKLGLIKGKSTKDPDIRAIESQEGMGGYNINATALERWIKSGFDAEQATPQKDDTFVSYDWAQPLSIALTVGANMASSKKTADDKAQAIAESFVAGVDTLADQPLVSGMKNVFGKQSMAASAKDIAVNMPSSFTPTLLKQINDYTDNTKRDTTSPSFGGSMLNKVFVKTPILSKNLPEQKTVWGNTAKKYRDDNNSFFNVFINPAFVNSYNPSPEAELVFDLYQSTGENKHAPQVQKKSVSGYGYTIDLDGETRQAMQKYTGEKTKDFYTSLLNDENFLNADDQDKVDYIQKQISEIGQSAKAKFLGNKFLELAQKNGDQSAIEKINQNLVQHQEADLAGDVFQKIKSMTYEERMKIIDDVNQENPYLYEELLKFHANDIAKKINSKSEQEKKAARDYATEIDEESEEYRKITSEYKSGEMSKNDSFTNGMSPRFVAEKVWNEMQKLQNPTEQINYLKGLKEKKLIKESAWEEFSKIKKNGGPIRTKAYKVPNSDNTYNMPENIK